MKALLLATAALLITLPAHSATVYLVLKSRSLKTSTGVGLSVVTIPMMSLDQCEEQGALLISSERFDMDYEYGAFECITGK